MNNPLANNDVRLNETVQALNGRGESLALQHLNYALTMEQNRAILTEHAMRNTTLLMEYATQIIGENPEATGPIKKIVYSYLEATSEDIRVFGRPHARKALEGR